jgi:hypothetical protein
LSIQLSLFQWRLAIADGFTGAQEPRLDQAGCLVREPLEFSSMHKLKASQLPPVQKHRLDNLRDINAVVITCKGMFGV